MTRQEWCYLKKLGKAQRVRTYRHFISTQTPPVNVKAAWILVSATLAFYAALALYEATQPK